MQTTITSLNLSEFSMTLHAHFSRNFSSEEGSMVYGCTKDAGTVATEEETRFSSYQSSDSSDGTDGVHSQLQYDNNNFIRYQQIDEEEDSSTSRSASGNASGSASGSVSNNGSGNVSYSSGDYATNTSTDSSDDSSGWDEDMENLMTWMNDTIIQPKVKVLAWQRALADGNERRRPPVPVASEPSPSSSSAALPESAGIEIPLAQQIVSAAPQTLQDDLPTEPIASENFDENNSSGDDDDDSDDYDSSDYSSSEGSSSGTSGSEDVSYNNQPQPTFISRGQENGIKNNGLPPQNNQRPFPVIPSALQATSNSQYNPREARETSQGQNGSVKQYGIPTQNNKRPFPVIPSALQATQNSQYYAEKAGKNSQGQRGSDKQYEIPTQNNKRPFPVIPIELQAPQSSQYPAGKVREMSQGQNGSVKQSGVSSQNNQRPFPVIPIELQATQNSQYRVEKTRENLQGQRGSDKQYGIPTQNNKQPFPAIRNALQTTPNPPFPVGEAKAVSTTSMPPGPQAILSMISDGGKSNQKVLPVPSEILSNGQQPAKNNINAIKVQNQDEISRSTVEQTSFRSERSYPIPPISPTERRMPLKGDVVIDRPVVSGKSSSWTVNKIPESDKKGKPPPPPPPKKTASNISRIDALRFVESMEGVDFSSSGFDSGEFDSGDSDGSSDDDSSDGTSDSSGDDGSSWSSQDEESTGDHENFVNNELARKRDYGGWKSLASTHSACSSLSELSVSKNADRSSFAEDSRNRFSLPPGEVASRSNKPIPSRPAPPERRYSMSLRKPKTRPEEPAFRKESEPPVKSKDDKMLDHSFSGADDSYEDLSYHVELPEPIDFEDIEDPVLQKNCTKLYRKLNQDPWDEFNKYRDDDVCDFIRIHPETCKVRYVFDHFSSRLFPLTMLSTLGASRHTMELAYEAYEDAAKEKDICIGTPLHYAATYKAKPSVIEFLVEVEPSMLTCLNQFGRTPLHMACLFKAPSKTVTFLLSEHPSATESADKDGYTPLHLACEHGANNEVIRRLVSANPNACLLLTKTESTPLHLACSHGASRATTRSLVQAKPEAAQYQDSDGKTPLHLAAQANAPVAIIEMLVKACPESIHVKSKRGQTALKIAKQKKAPFAVQKLLGA